MPLRLDYITIIALIVGFYIPEYAIVGEIAVNILAIIMGITSMIMLLALNDIAFKLKESTPTPPKTIGSKVASWVVLIVLVGLTAQAGYVPDAFIILVLAGLNKLVAALIKDKINGVI